MERTIRFGTDGWRGIIAEDFTFENLRLVAQALADYLDEGSEDKRIAIGYDNRFLSEDFAAAVAEVLAGNGITVYLSPRPCPTPHVSYFVNKNDCPLGVMITASHNNFRYNGIKIKERYGGSARESTTRNIEAFLGNNPVRSMSIREARNKGKLIEMPLDKGYGDLIESLVDIQAIRNSNLSVVVDSMHGVGGKLLERWIASPTCRVATLNGERDALFDMGAPEPKEENLALLRDAVLAENADVGLATDGDGDRSGAIHRDGSTFTPLEMIALLALYLAEEKGQKGVIAATHANTLYLERIARDLGLPYADKPVGFKYIAELMQQEEILVGGEESGGITVQGFLPERDGILINLLILEMMVKKKKNSLELLQELYGRYGEFHFRRKDFPVVPEKGKRMIAALTANPPEKFMARRIESIDTLDGLKLRFEDGSWILFRQSGTEPSLRIYCEAPSKEDLDPLIDAGMKALGEAYGKAMEVSQSP